jgi:MOSC domain-containing protein YiiM
MPAVLTQLNVSGGGMPKLPVAEARVTREGVAGDWQRNRKYHGGPNRAVCVYSEELYGWLRDQGVDVAAGAVGENFTTRGVDLQRLAKGDRLRVGDACVIELTDVRVPCNNLKKWDVDLPELIVGRSGWVAKVVAEGTVRPGDAIEVLPRGGDDVRATSTTTTAAPAATTTDNAEYHQGHLWNPQPPQPTRLQPPRRRPRRPTRSSSSPTTRVSSRSSGPGRTT